MTRAEMIAALDGEIARLERVRELLVSSTSDNFSPTTQEGPAGGKKPRVLSDEARDRIAQAQKRRWAKQRQGDPSDSENSQ